MAEAGGCSGVGLVTAAAVVAAAGGGGVQAGRCCCQRAANSLLVCRWDNMRLKVRRRGDVMLMREGCLSSAM